MIERALLLALAVLLVALVALAVTAWVRRRRRALVGQEIPLQESGLVVDRPTILYFSAPHCLACRTAQTPALSALRALLGERVAVVEVDTTARPTLADRLQILTVPSTVLLGGDGKVAEINHGFAPADRLLAQLQALDASLAPPGAAQTRASA